MNFYIFEENKVRGLQ